MKGNRRWLPAQLFPRLEVITIDDSQWLCPGWG